MFGFRQRQPGLPSIRKQSFVTRETREESYRQRQEEAYSKRSGHKLPPITPGESAALKTKAGWKEEVTVEEVRPSGRSYAVTKEDGEEVIRNRKLLRPLQAA